MPVGDAFCWPRQVSNAGLEIDYANPLERVQQGVTT